MIDHWVPSRPMSEEDWRKYCDCLRQLDYFRWKYGYMYRYRLDELDCIFNRYSSNVTPVTSISTS
jgi:hypothetical protein